MLVNSLTQSGVVEATNPAAKKLPALNFTKSMSFLEIRERLGSRYVKISNVGKIFKLDDDGRIIWENPRSETDFILDLKDAGLDTSDSDIKRILGSDYIKDITPLHFIFESISSGYYDPDTEPDYINEFVDVLKLKGDAELNRLIVRKSILTAYSLAFKGIDDQIEWKPIPRVIPIFYSPLRELGKSSALRWLGLAGQLLEAIPSLGQDVYAELEADMGADKREFDVLMSSCLMINFDDMSEIFLESKNKAGIRSLSTKQQVQSRTLFTNKISYVPRRAYFFGSTNELILRDASENRFAILEFTDLIDIEWLKNNDAINLWRQARYECLKLRDKSNFSKDDTDLILGRVKEYLFKTPLETALEDRYLFDPKGRTKLSEVKNYLREQDIDSGGDKVLVSAIKKIIPPNEKQQYKIGGTTHWSIRPYNEQEERANELDELFNKSKGVEGGLGGHKNILQNEIKGSIPW